jgi:hypothetical protein
MALVPGVVGNLIQGQLLTARWFGSPATLLTGWNVLPGPEVKRILGKMFLDLFYPLCSHCFPFG